MAGELPDLVLGGIGRHFGLESSKIERNLQIFPGRNRFNMENKAIDWSFQLYIEF